MMFHLFQITITVSKRVRDNFEVLREIRRNEKRKMSMELKAKQAQFTRII
ncbi:YrzI family small protein [Salipaludibacillus keqinensis]|nr:YrzI family small protein [Salipaludibacillus keqinensis]